MSERGIQLSGPADYGQLFFQEEAEFSVFLVLPTKYFSSLEAAYRHKFDDLVLKSGSISTLKKCKHQLQDFPGSGES